jgi:hypothetical protein
MGGNTTSAPIVRVKRERISFDPRGLMVIQQVRQNVYPDLKTGDILLLSTKNSGIVGLGKVSQFTGGDDSLVISQFRAQERLGGLPNQIRWGHAFIKAIRKAGEELLWKKIPNVNDLEGKLQVTVNLKRPIVVNEPTAATIPEAPEKRLPNLDFNSDGVIQDEAFMHWVRRANDELMAGEGLNFGELAESLPEELSVYDVGYQPNLEEYESTVFSRIRGVKIVRKKGVCFLDVPARKMPKARNEDVDLRVYHKGAGISYSVRAGEPREIGLADYMAAWYRYNPNNESDDVAPIRRPTRWLSVVDHEEGNVVVDSMEVEKIEKLRTKAGGKIYRLTLIGMPRKPGACGVCSVWIKKTTTAIMPRPEPVNN